MLLWGAAAQPVPAQAFRRRPLQLGVAMLAVAALTTWLVTAAGRVDAAVASSVVDNGARPAAAEAPGVLAGAAAALDRTHAEIAVADALELELRHADGSPAAAVGVLAHRAGRDPDFGAACAVSGADGRVILRDLPAGAVTVLIDRGVQLGCTVPPDTRAPQVVTLPAGVDVAGIVRDANGRPAAGAGIWMCRERSCPSEGSVVAHAGADGRFALRGVQPAAFLAAVREGSVPSVLHTIGSSPEAELVLGGDGACITGRVLGGKGEPVAGAVVRISRHPRAHFLLPGGRAMEHVHPCTVVRTDAAGAFAVADVPPGPMQVLVRAPGHCTEIESVVAAPRAQHRVELHLHAGIDLDGEVRDQAGLPVADARVLARGVVRSAWASVRTAPDGSFVLAGLDPGRSLLEVDAAGFVPASVPIARDAGRLVVVLQVEARVVLRLQDAAGAAVQACEWELGACARRAGQMLVPKPLERAGEAFVAGGELAGGPFVVRRQGTHVWLRTEPSGGDPNVLRIPAAAERVGSLCLSLTGTTAEQRRDLVLLVERDGLQQPIAPADPSAALLDFGRVAVGDNRAVLFSRSGLLPALDLGVVTVAENGAPLVVAMPAYGWLRHRLQRTDREPVLQCVAFVTDQRGLQVPLRGADGRVALAAGRYQLWASSLSFPAVGHAFEVAAAHETVLDLEVSPGKVRYVTFRLPPDADPQQCRARVRSTGEPARGSEGARDFPHAERGFDTTADGLCYTTLVLGDGDYVLDVQCGGRAFRSRFGVAGEDGVAEPIEVELRVER